MALVTAAQCREYITGLTGSSQDAGVIADLIARADPVLAHLCGYEPPTSTALPTLEDATYTWYLDGPGGQVLRLPVGPLVTITSIFDDPERGYGAAYEVAATDWDLDLIDSTVILTNTGTHGGWSTSYRSIKATAVCGYATVPLDITHAAATLVAHWYSLKNVRGKSSVGQGGVSTSYRAETVPDSVRQIIAPYRQMSNLFGVI